MNHSQSWTIHKVYTVLMVLHAKLLRVSNCCILSKKQTLFVQCNIYYQMCFYCLRLVDLVSWSGKHGHLPQLDHSQIMVNHGYDRPESKSERTT